MTALRVLASGTSGAQQSDIEDRVRRGDIAALLSDIDAGLYKHDEAYQILQDVITRERGPSAWRELFDILRAHRRG
jgi:hypothetical protein